MEMKKSWTQSLKPKEVEYKKKENQNKIVEKKDHTKDFYWLAGTND